MSSTREERIRVAVRVRPFNKREKAKNCKLVVQMEGNKTIIINPNDSNDRRVFSYDHSYWSTDGFKQHSSGRFEADLEHDRGHQYCDQKKIFADLGEMMLKNTFEGYNSTLFSYGQTGSGKSYSVMGYDANEGIVPQFCRKMLKLIEERSNEAAEFEVYLSMLEIYNEVVRDLLNPSKIPKGLKVREHPKSGFYADGLKSFPVADYEEIDRLIAEGTLNRTVAATLMNQTSSRAHTIVVLRLVQKKTLNDRILTTTSLVNIVDLAGSERVKGNGSTSQRFREGLSINKSLSALGNVIRALAESSTAKNPTTLYQISYRDSALTKLLMNALEGNSKTIMIATISPADVSYEETISTLRYAERVKKISTRVSVNEDRSEKPSIPEESIEGSTEIVTTSPSAPIDPNPELLNYQFNGRPPQLSGSESEEISANWEDELRSEVLGNSNDRENKISPRDTFQPTKTNRHKETDEKKQQQRQFQPYLTNINVDPLLNGNEVHILAPGATFIGKDAVNRNSIQLLGPGMQSKHAEVIVDSDQRVTLRSLSDDGRILVNGSVVLTELVLQNNDRLVFGSTQRWLFREPQDLTSSAQFDENVEITYEFFLQEVAIKAGLNLASPILGPDTESLQKELISMLPFVEEANGISAELDKRVKFEIVVIPPPNAENSLLLNRVFIMMKDLANDCDFLWPKEKFLTRFDSMREIYRRSQSDHTEDSRIFLEEDPFQEPMDTVVTIGSALVDLQPLAYLMGIAEKIGIFDLRGVQMGLIEVEIVPCDKNGQEFQDIDDFFIDDPNQLIGEVIYLRLTIVGCRGLPVKYEDLHCSYRFFVESTETQTESVPSTPNPIFDHARILHIKPVTPDFIKYLMEEPLEIGIMGKRVDSRRSTVQKSGPFTTRQLLRQDTNMFSEIDVGSETKKHISSEQQKQLMNELVLVKKTHTRIQQRLELIRQLADRSQMNGQEHIPADLLDTLLNVNSLEQAEDIVQQYLPEEDEDDVRGEDIERRLVELEQKEQKSSICSVL